MKSFTEYLTESKKVYEFKIKLAGDYKKAGELIKSALSQYKVESCSAGKRLPIAETHADFPHITNTDVTIFDVCTSYPVTSQQVRALIAEKCRCPIDSVRVRNLAEDAEDAARLQPRRRGADPGRNPDQGREADRGRDHRRGSSEGRSACGQHSQPAPAGALQGQGHQVCQ